jgi:hypothetical protein
MRSCGWVSGLKTRSWSGWSGESWPCPATTRWTFPRIVWLRSSWVALLHEAYPKASIRATVYVRASGGCQHYREKRRVAKYILPHKPDLVIIGGISQQDVTCIRTVIDQIRVGLPEVEIILATGAFGNVDPRDAGELAAAPCSGTGEYGVALQRLAKDKSCAYLDMTTPWAEYIRSSKLHPHRFYRDPVHANEYGEQVLAKVMMSFLGRREIQGLMPQARVSLP